MQCDYTHIVLAKNLEHQDLNQLFKITCCLHASEQPNAEVLILDFKKVQGKLFPPQRAT